MKSTLPLLAILALHALFIKNNTYSIDHVDSLMHFAGGIALGIQVAGLLSFAVRRQWCPSPGSLLDAVLIISLVTSGAVAWEFYEWLSDHFLGTLLQLTVDDTIKDLAFGVAGGAVSALLHHSARTRRSYATRALPLSLRSEPGSTS